MQWIRRAFARFVPQLRATKCAPDSGCPVCATSTGAELLAMLERNPTVERAEQYRREIERLAYPFIKY
jgi:hypothetical protein